VVVEGVKCVEVLLIGGGMLMRVAKVLIGMEGCG
jgi:hypothetical protein